MSERRAPLAAALYPFVSAGCVGEQERTRAKYREYGRPNRARTAITIVRRALSN